MASLARVMSRRLMAIPSLLIEPLHLSSEMLRPAFSGLSLASEPDGALGVGDPAGADGALGVEAAVGADGGVTVDGADVGEGAVDVLAALPACALLISVRIGLQYAAPSPSPNRFSAARRVRVLTGRVN